MKITIANSCKSRNWQIVEISIRDLWRRIRTPLVGEETLDEFLRLPKAQQDKLKDVAGGFVGGELTGHRRLASAVQSRQLVTLDFDRIPPHGTAEVLARARLLGAGYCIHSTRKHQDAAPRLRLLVPLDRPVTADEYEPIARAVADVIGITMADPTTYESNRLMYWPTVCRNATYVYEVSEDTPLSAEATLARYTDWRDAATWPHTAEETVSIRQTVAKADDPLAKPGIVGAFCRCYDVVAAMERFLPGMYAPTGSDNRYTYLGGSTTGGVVIYEGGKYLYSHHATDPCSRRLVNAFDLVRLHKYGDLDADNPDAPITQLPSYKAMCGLAVGDDAVASLMLRESREAAAKDFAALAPTQSETKSGEDTAIANTEEWERGLARTAKGGVAQTINNVITILSKDPALSGVAAKDTFYNNIMLYGNPPWARPKNATRAWSDEDTAKLYWYMETRYRIDRRTAIDAGLVAYTSAHARDALEEHILALPEWDGTERLDRLLIDYLGAEDTEYVRTITRKSLVAAIQRALEPGCKYDQMTILYSRRQGLGKSTLIRTLGEPFFTDSLPTLDGKDAQEQLPGHWIIEIAELDAMRRSDTENVKKFLSIQVDGYRAAYGRRREEHPRRCVFWGSCNRGTFLRDVTGNRRFWVIDCDVIPPTKSPFEGGPLRKERDQIWAEALHKYRQGDVAAVLPPEIEAEARAAQDKHADQIPIYGQIADFVERPIPRDWDSWPIDKRMTYWAAWERGEQMPGVETAPRQCVCAMEIWRECLGQIGLLRAGSMDARDIGEVLASLDGWQAGGQIQHKTYGHQRAFYKHKEGK